MGMKLSSMDQSLKSMSTARRGFAPGIVDDRKPEPGSSPVSFSVITVAVNSDADMVAARGAVRQLALDLGFRRRDPVLIATAVSELARNILEHAGTGSLSFQAVTRHGMWGLSVVAEDDGPGIPDIARAFEEGYTAGP